MAEIFDPNEVRIALTDELHKALQEMREDLKARQAALSEERIRLIIRDELAKWEQRQKQALRWSGMPLRGEVK